MSSKGSNLYITVADEMGQLVLLNLLINVYLIMPLKGHSDIQCF